MPSLFTLCQPPVPPPTHTRALTLQGMMAVKPGRSTTLPVAVKVSPPASNVALVLGGGAWGGDHPIM